jgi:arsenate reductase
MDVAAAIKNSARFGDGRRLRAGSTIVRKVVFACIHNAGRSQIAAAFFSALADPNKARAISAGTSPATAVHAEVITAMREAGIDLSREKPKILDATIAENANDLITMGCGEECPIVPGARREDWPVEDPKGLSIERVRAIRDEIRSRVERFIRSERLD